MLIKRIGVSLTTIVRHSFFPMTTLMYIIVKSMIRGRISGLIMYYNTTKNTTTYQHEIVRCGRESKMRVFFI